MVAQSFDQGHTDCDTPQHIGVTNTFEPSHSHKTRLTTVSGATMASFFYDGNGNRVKATFGSGNRATITAYVGRQVEVSPAYREDFGDGLAQGGMAASGDWAGNGGGYRQSATISNTNANRSQT